MGIEPTYSAWKAEVLPLNYTRINHNSANEPSSTRQGTRVLQQPGKQPTYCPASYRQTLRLFGQVTLSDQQIATSNFTQPHSCEATSNFLVEGGGFEPPKVEPADLQSAPFGRSGTPPKI